ncbi:acylphosphatase [Acidiphilium sp. PA]|uniref:acylphosphatase n=1 Tax=Acidiphilium sp. PA TaxID=2871705 RepID=UPI00224372B4|nr:acylphosphatase [Acidiphilium sp. PA]MCW8307484.1 acylphosphatase [Acidiphilium sp. PA]
MIAKSLIFTGRVQGVGFRDWMVARARRLGLAGWVRNRRDGSLEALIAGDAPAVEELLRACRRGPPGAEVVTVTEDFAAPPAEPGFFKRPTAGGNLG